MDWFLAKLRPRWAQFKRDVFDDPTIRPVGATILSALAALIVWLTATYAPAGGEISPQWGWITIAIMTFLTLAAGFEPVVMGPIDRWWQMRGERAYRRLPWPLRSPLRLATALMLAPFVFASTIWSLVDYVLARPVAFLAGATWPDWCQRYAHFITLMIVIVWLIVCTPPIIGLIAVIAGLLAITAIVRRWAWIENDRDTFLVERGERKEGAGTLRIGFGEDLRDEALFALVWLFLLIPFGLDLVQQTTCAAHQCAFSTANNGSIPAAPLDRLVTWLGFFGAELAKTVPFVDWSEVFHVANGSPITARTTLGSQIHFVLRAGLDLLFLAAVVQAVGIASRLREQSAAFRNNRLSILDPFSEARELSSVGAAIDPALEVRASDQPVIKSFPLYDNARLKELIEERDSRGGTTARMAAAALLARQQGPEATEFLFRHANDEPDGKLRDWIFRLAIGLTPERAIEDRTADRSHLLALLADPNAPVSVRGAATRRLGRLGRLGGGEIPVALLLERLADSKEDLTLRADIVVALAKLAPGDTDVLSRVEELAGHFKGPLIGEPLLPAMATAYALARLRPRSSAASIAKLFDRKLQGHARRGALIQAEPMALKAARARKIGDQTEQMVRMTPGLDPFPKKFNMGSTAKDVGARPDQFPETEIEMTRHFAIGRFPVTNREFSGFCDSLGLPRSQYHENSDWPVVNTTWYDANAYANWVERIKGERYRLPSEAEAEYACRAGTTTRYWWGDKWAADRAPAGANASVNRYRPNPWGIWCVYGHVYEWCADPWHKNHKGRPTNDAVWLEGGHPVSRTIRSGSFNWPPEHRRNKLELRSSYRNEQRPDHRQTNYGFRLARTLSV